MPTYEELESGKTKKTTSTAPFTDEMLEKIVFIVTKINEAKQYQFQSAPTNKPRSVVKDKKARDGAVSSNAPVADYKKSTMIKKRLSATQIEGIREKSTKKAF